MTEHNHMPEWMGEIRRGKALGLIVSGATISDADGTVVDLARLNADGTFVESDEVVEVADEATEEAATPKRKKAPAPSFDEAAAATKAKKTKADDAE